MDNIDLRLLIDNLENNIVYDECGVAHITREAMQFIINAIKSSKSFKCCSVCTYDDCKYMKGGKQMNWNEQVILFGFLCWVIWFVLGFGLGFLVGRINRR